MSKPPIVGSADIEINASLEKVWHLIAVEFDHIDRWSSGVIQSTGSGASVNGSPVGERACKIAAVGFSDTKERILEFDPMRVIRYHLYHGLPGFVQRAENAWTFQPLTPARTRITGRTEMHVTGIMGWMMGGMMKKSLDRVLGEMCTEAKHIIETGQPHPKKVAQIEKLRRRNR